MSSKKKKRIRAAPVDLPAPPYAQPQEIASTPMCSVGLFNVVCLRKCTPGWIGSR